MTTDRDEDATTRTRTAAGPAPTDTVVDAGRGYPIAISRGTHIGRYVALDRLGKGGMGVVYRAHDPELDRAVAIKLLRVKRRKPEAEERAKARLLREAQALARLSHPNVISVFDAGTFGDQVFIAMELVEGENVAKWLRDSERSLDEILGVFLDAGRGLAAAHGAGLIHRDFKPHNAILGNDGRVKVLDFGLAKSVAAPLATPIESDESSGAEETPASDRLLEAPLTRDGVIVGTPKYMSPEQLLGEEVDERTDQFSFCVALYEAVYGERPFAGDSVTQLVPAITEGKIKPAPTGSTVPRRIRKILLRGMSGSPAERYSSMSALLHDLGRDPRERLRKIGFGAALATMAALALFGLTRSSGESAPTCEPPRDRLAGVWDPTTRAEVEKGFLASGRAHAPATFALVAERLDQYTDAWLAMHEQTCRATRERGEQSEKLMDLRMACLDRRLEEVRALTRLFAQRASGKVVDRAVSAAAAFGDLAQCADTAALTAQVEPPANADTRAQVDGLDKRLAAARALRLAGSYKEGRIIAEEVVQRADRLGYAPLIARALVTAATLQDDDGDAKGAEASLRRAIQVASEAGDDRIAGRAWVQLLWVVGYRKSATGDISNLLLGAESAVARAGKPPALEAMLLTNLAAVMYTRGKYDQARALYDRTLSLRQKSEADTLEVASTLNNLGLVHYRQGDYRRAASYHRRVLTIREARLGKDHPVVASALNNLGIVTERQGRYTDARKYFRRALEIKEATLGREHPTLAGTLNNLGNTYMQTGDTETAMRLLRRALAIKEKAHGKEHPRVAITLDNLADAMIRSGRFREAQAILERSLAISQKKLGDAHPDTAYTLSSLAEAYLGLGDPTTAVALAERALAARLEAKTPAVELAETELILAMALWKRRTQRKRALRLARHARAAFAAAGRSGERRLRQADAWLAGK